MRVGDLVKLAAWCKNGPALMQLMDHPVTTSSHVQALFLEGIEIGHTVRVSCSNIFTLEDYDGAMKKHYERR
jgi:hypothetical protein